MTSRRDTLQVDACPLLEIDAVRVFLKGLGPLDRADCLFPLAKIMANFTTQSHKSLWETGQVSKGRREPRA